MKRHLFAAILLLLGGCEESGVYDVVNVRFFNLEDSDDLLLDEASEMLGMEIAVVDNASPGDVVIFLDDSRNIGGWLDALSKCDKAGWSAKDPESLAHELGHALHLEHSEDDENLMWEHVTAHDTNLLTDDQVDTMRRMAWHMHTQCD